MWSPNDKVWSPKWKNEESNFVKVWNYWRILHKNIPLSLKMSACRGLRSPYLLPGSCPDLLPGFAPGPHGDSVPQTHIFVESKKSLNYTLELGEPPDDLRKWYAKMHTKKTYYNRKMASIYTAFAWRATRGGDVWRRPFVSMTQPYTRRTKWMS